MIIRFFKCTKILLFIWFLDKRKLTEKEKGHIERYDCCNHNDLYLDVPKESRFSLQLQWTSPCESIKLALEWSVNDVSGYQDH